MNRAEFDARVDSILLYAEKLIPKRTLPDLPYMELAPTVRDWYDFEHELWELGENTRQLILSERKDLNAEQADRICRICENVKAKEGARVLLCYLGRDAF